MQSEMLRGSGAEQKFVTASGVQLAYRVAGHGPPVVCIQGVGVAGTGWDPQVDGLRDRFTLITIDNRGIGQSGLPSEPLTIPAMSADVAAVMDAEGHDRAHIVGHSMGGLIALDFALSRPQRVGSLGLICTFANGADVTRFSWRMAVLGIRSRVGTRSMRRRAMLDMVMPSQYLRRANLEATARDLAQLFGHDLADQPPIAWAQLRATSRYNATSRLAELSRVPTLVVSGRHDPVAPPALGRAIANVIEGAKYEEFAEASHALPIQCAEALNTLLSSHIRSADTGVHT